MPYNDKGVGWQRTDTSYEAADKVNAGTLRAMALDCVKKHGPISADGVADLCGVPFISMRPRLTELRNAGKIVDTGQRGLSSFGRKAILWGIPKLTNGTAE